MSFDEIFDLTAGVYFNFYDIIVGVGWHRRCKTLPGICILRLALVGNDAVKYDNHCVS